MKFGEYLKNRRTKLGWTQPEAAAKSGIEQSYLSKLETSKSIPSEDVYHRLVEAFGIETEAMVGTLYPAELDRLREIEAVRKHLLQRDYDMRFVTQRWLYAGLAMLILGGGFLGLAQMDRGSVTPYYTYQSSGVILPGEGLDVFGAVDDEIDPNARDRPDQVARREALIARVDERIRSTPEMIGPSFTENVAEGRRQWRLVGSSEVRVPGRLGWAFAPGLALILGGLGCFFISWRRP
jgi:transcriptional regulator with XRE-family HTH domain